MEISFFGATGTVTGSKYLITSGESQVLVDCGLFQGFKQLRRKNWLKPPFEPHSINAVVLTHAHLDHSGYIPLLVKQGFRGKIFCTPATYELCRIMLPNSGFLQEEQARFENRHSLSKHKPALPLYTQEDAERCLERFTTEHYDLPIKLTSNLTALLRPSGHLLGAASVRLQDETSSINFSGDVGRSNDPMMKPPAPLQDTDYLVIESTYGDRKHPAVDMEADLVRHLVPAIERGATIVVPAFAIGRAQLLLLLIAKLKARKVIGDIPVYLDSPMAIDATELYRIFSAEHRLSLDECKAMLRAAKWVRTAEESKALARNEGAQIIVSASGMATGGRVLHHLKRCAPDLNNLILLTGFQAGGTRGASLAAGARNLRIFGQDIAVNAEVVQLDSMSAHADADELLTWMQQLSQPPRRVFITHGEPNASEALRQRIQWELKWNAEVPEYGESVALD